MGIKNRGNFFSRVRLQSGFALPTVLIASIVMLTVLAVTVSATTSIRTNLKTQYYSQLAQAAGDAGVAFAKACLAANDNIPTWSNANPLTPNTDCTGAPAGGYPTTVSSNGDVISTFSVGLPTTDSSGRAVTIPNSGYVQLLRTSTGAVWKTYTQPTAQAAVVPDLCSGAATSTLGWVNATERSSSYGPIEGTPISTSSANVNPGPAYFRKDFTVTSAGSHTISMYANDIAEIFIDGEYVSKAELAVTGTATVNSTVNLSAGCHTILVKLTNAEITANSSVIVATIKKTGSSKVLAKTDTSWRVASVDGVSFSQNNYYAKDWVTPRVVGWYNSSPWTSGPINWYAITADYNARWLGTMSYAAGAYPSASWTYFRTSSTSPLSVPVSTEYKFSVACDDRCNVYVDGNRVIDASAGWSTVYTSTLTLAEGDHTIGVELYNAGASANSSGFIFSAMRTSDSRVVLDSNTTGWVASNDWYSSQQNLYSYDNSYLPNPSLPTGTVNALIVGGGGGGGSRHGGGGGAGGVVYDTDVDVVPGVYPIVIGSGGAGTPSGAVANNDVSTDGGNSSGLGLVAFGGGGGKGGYVGALGGSGGGGGPNYAGGLVMSEQGYPGGSGLYSTYYMGGGGGGAGGPGQNAAYPSNTQPAGGVGVSNSITGSLVTYAAGGRGASYNLNTVGVAGAANTGNGGGGAGGETNGGAAGGSGVLVISYPTGSITATGGTITTSGGNTIHRFTSNGNFIIQKVDSPSTPSSGSGLASINTLVVAGGGGGGTAGASGGGGSGGVVSTTYSLSATGNYPVVVGAGGAQAVSGSNSSVFGLIAVGGGAGAWNNGESGGSGGGSGRGAASSSYFAPGVSGQGNNGGTAGLYSGRYPASGGGGAGAPGQSVVSASPANSGAGGDGVASTITGSSVMYGGGGGGGGDYGCSRNLGPGAGGSGGGGAGGNSANGNGVAGTANTGGGGGGATQLSSCSASGSGGAGGSGVVIISYPTGSITATGGTITTSGGNTIHRFTSNGTFTVTSIN